MPLFYLNTQAAILAKEVLSLPMSQAMKVGEIICVVYASKDFLRAKEDVKIKKHYP